MTEKRNYDAEIQEQQEIIRKANERIGELVKERGGWFPMFPEIPTFPVLPPFPTFPVFPEMPVFPTLNDFSCRECGLIWDGPMGYVCPNPKCPTGVNYSSTK